MPNPTISATGMRLVELLVGHPPRSVEELAEALGLTRTAVTEPLGELMTAGFVRRIEERRSRGRPRYLYSATDAALLHLFPGSQSLVVPAMWRAIEEIGGVKLRRQVLKRVSNALAEHYKRQLKGKTPAKRLRELAKVLRKAEGNLVEIEGDGGRRLAIRRRSCSFFSMFEESRAVCQIDEKMVGAIIAAPVKKTACRHDGDPCCIFEIVTDG